MNSENNIPQDEAHDIGVIMGDTIYTEKDGGDIEVAPLEHAAAAPDQETPSVNIGGLDFLMGRSEAALATHQRRIAPKKTHTPRDRQPTIRPQVARGVASSDKIAQLLAGNTDGFREIPQDGVNCINISNDPRSTGPFGHSLSIASPLPLVHSVLGHFSSIEGFLFYISLSTGEEALGWREASHTKTGQQLRDLRDSAQAKGLVRSNKNKMFLLADALWQRVQSNPDLVYKIRESTLPFRSFTHYASGEMKPGMFSTEVEMTYDRIREALKNDTVPNFDDLFVH